MLDFLGYTAKLVVSIILSSRKHCWQDVPVAKAECQTLEGMQMDQSRYPRLDLQLGCVQVAVSSQ